MKGTLLLLKAHIQSNFVSDSYRPELLGTHLWRGLDEWRRQVCSPIFSTRGILRPGWSAEQDVQVFFPGWWPPTSHNSPTSLTSKPESSLISEGAARLPGREAVWCRCLALSTRTSWDQRDVYTVGRKSLSTVPGLGEGGWCTRPGHAPGRDWKTLLCIPGGSVTWRTSGVRAFQPWMRLSRSSRSHAPRFDILYVFIHIYISCSVQHISK